MKIASWNIRGVRGIQRRRHANIIEALSTAALDIVLLQEVASQWDDVHAVRNGLGSIAGVFAGAGAADGGVVPSRRGSSASSVVRL